MFKNSLYIDWLPIAFFYGFRGWKMGNLGETNPAFTLTFSTSGRKIFPLLTRLRRRVHEGNFAGKCRRFGVFG